MRLFIFVSQDEDINVLPALLSSVIAEWLFRHYFPKKYRIIDFHIH